MSDRVKVLGFQKEYQRINLKLKKEDELLYDLGILVIYTLERNFKVKKILKTTSKGTKVNYEGFKDAKEIVEYCKFIDGKMNEFKEKWNIQNISEKFKELNLRESKA